jgi:hypothetical protein
MVWILIYYLPKNMFSICHYGLLCVDWGHFKRCNRFYDKAVTLQNVEKVQGSEYFPFALSVQNIRNTFLILSCNSFCPQNSLNSSGHGLHMVWKETHRDAGPWWLQCFPQLCQVGWEWISLPTDVQLDRNLVTRQATAVSWIHLCSWKRPWTSLGA